MTSLSELWVPQTIPTVPCMAATPINVREGTKVVRPRSDRILKCTDKDRSEETEIEH